MSKEEAFLQWDYPEKKAVKRIIVKPQIKLSKLKLIKQVKNGRLEEEGFEVGWKRWGWKEGFEVVPGRRKNSSH